MFVAVREDDGERFRSYQGVGQSCGFRFEKVRNLRVTDKFLNFVLWHGLIYSSVWLCSAYDYEIPARGKELVKTDLQIQLPPGCYGRVAPRSGLAWKNHIDVGGTEKCSKF